MFFLMLDMTYQELNRLGIYGIYQYSFLRFVVEFDIWYMESMNTVDAFVQCFCRIQEDEKNQILGLDQACGSEYLLRKYENIISSFLEQYLFSEMKHEETSGEGIHIQSSKLEGVAFSF